MPTNTLVGWGVLTHPTFRIVGLVKPTYINYKNSSDIDLAITGKNIDFAFISHLAAELDELPTPYMFDLLEFDTILNEKLKLNIATHGKILYERE